MKLVGDNSWDLVSSIKCEWNWSMGSTKLHKLKSAKDSKYGVQEFEKTGLRVFNGRSHLLWREKPSKLFPKDTEIIFCVMGIHTLHSHTSVFEEGNTCSKTAFDESTAKYHKRSRQCIFKHLLQSSFRWKRYLVEITLLPQSPYLVNDCIGSRIWAALKFLRACLVQLVFLCIAVKDSVGHLLKTNKKPLF